VLVPHELQRALQVAESFAVTADPEVADERPEAILLIAGHPALEASIARVLERGDVGNAYVAWPAASLPSAQALLAAARASIDVDHGRIDLEGDAKRAYLPVLRLGVLVEYTLDERFGEREEVWVEASSGVPFDDPAARARFAQASPLESRPDGSARIIAADLPLAFSVAHESLLAIVAARAAELSRQARSALRSELARAAGYYDATLETIARRVEIAPPERKTLLRAQAEATQLERIRRVREIEGKYEPTFEIRPFRAHVLHVPALVLPITIRRGDRAYAFEFTWLLPTRAFAPFRCPACRAITQLVAGRDRLGCKSCIPRR
jgi:hypothetical protein